MAAIAELSNVSNDAIETIGASCPYVATIAVQGTAAFLFHRWSVDDVEAKSKAAKGSKAKKSDNLETYVYRSMNGELVIPSEYFRMAIIGAAKFQQDPRSPRKSAMDLFKAGICGLEDCGLGKHEWDFVDRRRVMVQRNGITRSRPAMFAGWKTTVRLQILVPEYISSALLNETVQTAGRLIGVGDFRPTFGRFAVTGFSIE